MISYSSRVCGKPFDDSKGRWRGGGGINVPIILQFAMCRSQALNIKGDGDVSKTGISVALSSNSSDDEKCLREVAEATPSPFKREVECTDEEKPNNNLQG